MAYMDMKRKSDCCKKSAGRKPCKQEKITDLHQETHKKTGVKPGRVMFLLLYSPIQ
jgi:hypothetical protein